MTQVPGFNPNDVARREWQSGAGFGTTARYWMKVPMFIRIRPGEHKPQVPHHLHPWVAAADKRSRAYRANPARPEVYDLGEMGLPVDIKKSKSTRLQRGDALAFSFTVVYVVGGKDWYPQLLPVDLVRVLEREPEKRPKVEPAVVNNMDVMVRPGRLDGSAKQRTGWRRWMCWRVWRTRRHARDGRGRCSRRVACSRL